MSVLDAIPIVTPVPDESKIPTRLAIDAFLEGKAPELRPASIAGYRWRLERFAKEFPGTLPMMPEAIRDFCLSQGKSDRTAKSMYVVVRALYFWLVEHRRVQPQDNPFGYMKAPKLRKKLPRVFTNDEMRRILDAARAGPERALVLVLLDSGARIGELAGRSKDDLTPHGLRVDGKSGARVLALSALTLAYLHEQPGYYLFKTKDRHQRWVDKPGVVNTLKHHFETIVTRAGITGARRGAHTVRHSAATSFLSSARNVELLRRYLGHATIQQALDYVSLSDTELRDAHAEHSPLLDYAGIVPAKPVKRANHRGRSVTLPDAVRDFPLFVNGEFVYLYVTTQRKYGTLRQSRAGVKDVRRQSSIYARWGEIPHGGKRRLATLGLDLPEDYIETWKIKVDIENKRRRRLAAEVTA